MSLDPNQHIYRIYPLWLFEEAIGSRQLVLASPRKWQDPYGILAENTTLIDKTTSINRNSSHFCTRFMRNVGR